MSLLINRYGEFIWIISSIVGIYLMRVIPILGHNMHIAVFPGLAGLCSLSSDVAWAGGLLIRVGCLVCTSVVAMVAM